MDAALAESRFVACLLSSAYLDSGWCREELEAGLVRDNLLLLRVGECDTNGLLRSRNDLNLVGAREEEARAQILSALKHREGGSLRPDGKPAFPACAPVDRTYPRYPGNLPEIWNIGEERNIHVAGRDQIIAALHRTLTDGLTAALTQTVLGLGGIGKTQIALEYAYRYVSEYDGVWWLRAEEPATPAHDYAALATRLGGLPLALEQAAAYIGECRKPLRDYAELLTRRGLELLDAGQAPQHQETVGATWALAIEQVTKKCPAAADLLSLLAYMAPDAINIRELADACDQLPARLSLLLRDELALDRAKAELLAFSLIRVEGDLFQAMERQTEAKSLYVRSLAILDGSYGCDDSRTQNVRKKLDEVRSISPQNSGFFERSVQSFRKAHE